MPIQNQLICEILVLTQVEGIDTNQREEVQGHLKWELKNKNKNKMYLGLIRKIKYMTYSNLNQHGECKVVVASLT